MTKNYQNKTASVAIAVEAAMPDAVSVTLAELAVSLREGLLALAVGTGFQVMDAVIDESVSVLAGPRGRHDQNRTAVRHGTEDGSVVLGGRRVPVRRPRVRTADRRAEVAVPAYELFSSTDVLSAMGLERMMDKLSTRRYAAGLEPVGVQVEATARSTSKSAISRRFVAATETALADMLAADLTDLDLVALMIDGVHFADHLCVVALGIGIDGTKHPLGLAEGDTENTTVVRDLLAALRDRGLNTTRPILCVLDGAKALSAGVQAVFDHPVIQRCQLHKIRNVEAKLPDNLASTVARTLRSTNAVESMIEICRDHSTNVKRWRDGQMALRWCAAGMLEAAKQFRRVNGFLHLPALREALNRHVAGAVTPPCQDEHVAA